MKNNKKLQNKLKKKALNLIKEFNITISENPTYNLYLGNTGMLCGYSREHLLKIFQQFGKVKSLIQMPQKSFSFLSYYSVEDAKQAKETFNNHVPIQRKSEEPTVPILIHFIDHIPKFDYMEKSYPKLDDFNYSDIEGLTIYREFVTEEEETLLTNCFLQTKGSTDSGTLKHRTVQHFGYEFLYGTNNINKSQPLKEKIPEICNFVQERILKEKYLSWEFDQLTVNTYEPGQASSDIFNNIGVTGIPSHIDTHSAFEDGIASLTLNSQTVMDFIHPHGTQIPVILPRRSLLLMKGAARYLWSHGIVPRKYDIIYTKDDITDVKDGLPDYHLTLRERGKRISLTFRKILHTPCRCSFHTKCDSFTEDQSEKLYIPESSSQANDLESEHVHGVYEEIAEHFSSTRHSPWPRVKAFIMSLEKGSLVADIGCGNGKYLGVNNDINVIGSDRSWNLCEICMQRGFSVMQSDIMHIPFRKNMFDACICIAVIHHLSTKRRRLDAIMELVRITRVNGSILIYVWAIEQANEKESVRDSIDNTGSADDADVECVERKEIRVSQGRNTFQQQDLLIPWHLKGDEEKIYHRFYHVFQKGELEELCEKIANVKVIDIYYDKGNWCIILKRIS